MEIIRGHYCSTIVCVCARLPLCEYVIVPICNPATPMQVPDCYTIVDLGHVETHAHSLHVSIRSLCLQGFKRANGVPDLLLIILELFNRKPAAICLCGESCNKKQ